MIHITNTTRYSHSHLAKGEFATPIGDDYTLNIQPKKNVLPISSLSSVLFVQIMPTTFRVSYTSNSRRIIAYLQQLSYYTTSTISFAPLPFHTSTSHETIKVCYTIVIIIESHHHLHTFSSSHAFSISRPSRPSSSSALPPSSSNPPTRPESSFGTTPPLPPLAAPPSPPT